MDSQENGSAISLAERFAQSERFKELFASGMGLVEETANFLDADGREFAKGLSRAAGAIYGAESMRLTTRLMQLASWLLLQRAVAEGEMTVEQALEEKKNVKLTRLQPRQGGPGWDELPVQFIALIERASALQRRIKRLDDDLYGELADSRPASENPVAEQQALLQTAFDRRFAG